MRLWDSVGKRKYGKPLPFDLQVRPRRIRRVRVHPGCGTFAFQWGIMMQLNHLDAQAFLSGRELSQVRSRFYIMVNGKRVGYTDDPHFALGWCNAARERGLDAHAYDINKLLYIQTSEGPVHHEPLS